MYFLSNVILFVDFCELSWVAIYRRIEHYIPRSVGQVQRQMFRKLDRWILQHSLQRETARRLTVQQLNPRFVHRNTFVKGNANERTKKKGGECPPAWSLLALKERRKQRELLNEYLVSPADSPRQSSTAGQWPLSHHVASDVSSPSNHLTCLI